MGSALFARDGDRFVPSEHTRGPWDDAAQHGGPPAALLARSLEALPSAVPMLVARCSVDILRPVPLTPLRVAAQVLRPGRRVQLVQASLSDSAGSELCRAQAWRIRQADLGDGLPPSAPVPFAGPDESVEHEPESELPAFHRTGVELRFARGSFWETGPCAVWIRLVHAVVQGEEPSPLMRVLAAADFGNGVSAAVPWGRYLYINTDLAVNLHRQPSGEWIGLDATTNVNRQGAGLAQSALYDVDGSIGRSLQTLLVDEMGGAAQ